MDTDREGVLRTLAAAWRPAESSTRLFLERSHTRTVVARARAGHSVEMETGETLQEGTAVDRYSPLYRTQWTHGLGPRAQRRLHRGEAGLPAVAGPCAPARASEKDWMAIAIDAARAEAPDAGAATATMISAVTVRAGNGPRGIWSRSDHEWRLQVRIGPGDRVLGSASHIMQGALPPDQEAIAQAAQRAVRNALVCSETAPAWLGRRDQLVAYLCPSAAGRWLHEVCGHPAEADWLGPVADASVSWRKNLFDRPGDWHVDDEGEPACPTCLGPGGVLTSAATPPPGAGSGNGRRQDYRYPPLPRMRRLELAGGRADEQSLTHHVDLFVEHIGHAAIDSRTGVIRLEAVARFKRNPAAPPTRAVLTTDLARAGHAVEGIGLREQETAVRCVKGGQVLTVAHRAPSLRIGGLSLLG